jgi:hypothetical protein
MADLKINNPKIVGKLKLPAESASKTLIVNSSGELTSSTVTDTELAHLSGVTSSVQTQISAKADSSALSNYVATSVTVNGHALSSNVSVTATDISLGNVDNTSDANKPVSTAQQTALDGKSSTTLSNLGTTAINSDLVPASDASADLGTVSKRWGATYAQTLGLALSSTGESIQVSPNGITKYESSDPLTSNNTLVIKAADTTDTTFVHDGGSVQIEAGNANNGLSAGNIDIIVGVGDTNNGNINFKNKDAANTINSTNYIQIAPGGSVTSIANSIQVIAQVGYADLVSTASDVRLFPATGHSVRVDSKQIKDVADPTANQDAATKLYVDTAVSGAGTGTFVPVSQKGAASGVATLDANSLIPIAQIPPSAIERLVIVADQTAQYALTIATVQIGDTVKVTSSGEMFFVVDVANLGNAAGYVVYSAGTAAAVAWSGITSIPTPVSSLSGTNTGDQDLSGLALKTYTVNGHALSGNVSVTATDLSLGNVDNTSDATKNAATVSLTNKTIDASLNTISKLTVAMLDSGVLDADLTSVSASDDTIPSAKATKSYVDSKIGASAVAGDITLTSFAAANNQVAAADVTGLAFAAGVTRSFKALVSVSINATTGLNEVYELLGVQLASGFVMSASSVGDDTGVVFSITSAGQVQYTSANAAGFVSNTVKFRADTSTI